MIGKKLDNKGMLTIFLAMVFLGILLLAGLMLDAARIMTADNKVSLALQSAGRSVLAGYDRDLVGEFGLYGVGRLEETKAREYFEKNLKESHPDFCFIHYNVTEFKLTSVAAQSLTVRGVLREQILRYMEIKGPLLLSENILDMLKDSGLQQRAGDFETGKKIAAEIEPTEAEADGGTAVNSMDLKDLFRRLQDPAFLKTINVQDLAELTDVSETGEAKDELGEKMKKTSERLNGLELASIVEESGNVSNSVMTLCRRAEEIALQGRNRLYQNEYIMDKFTFLTSTTLRDHYFTKGEVEYILCGSKLQAENLLAVAEKVFFLRFSLDTVYRFATGKLTQPIARLAEALILGFQDAGRDLLALYRGEGIPLFPASTPGQNAQGTLGYADHLRLLLLLQDGETQLARMQELIQVSLRTMKGEEKNAFLLKEYCDSIQIGTSVEINLWFLPLLHPEKAGFKNFTPNGYRIEKNVTLSY